MPSTKLHYKGTSVAPQGKGCPLDLVLVLTELTKNYSATIKVKGRADLRPCNLGKSMVIYVKSMERQVFPLKIQKASEDYLETMLMLQESLGYIRSIDIAEHLGVTKPSVSYATKRLRENGYITMDKDGLITLTETGMAIAKKMFQRHQILTEVFIKMGVDPEIAAEDACKIEHDLSQATFDAICRLADRIDL